MNKDATNTEAMEHTIIPKVVQKAKQNVRKVVCAGKKFQKTISSSKKLFYGVHNKPYSLGVCRRRYGRLGEIRKKIHYILCSSGEKLF